MNLRPLLQVLLFTTFLLVGCGLLAGCGGNPLDLASQAETAFQNGNYSSSEKTFQELVSRGNPNSHLLYNLASAQYRQGKLGAAIANLVWAESLAPADPDIKANLKYLRTKVNATDVQTAGAQPAWLVLFSWRRIASEALLSYIVLFLWLVNCWILSKGTRRRSLDYLGLFSTALFLSSAGALFFTRVNASSELVVHVPTQDAPQGVGVILRAETAARSDRTHDASVIAMLAEGSELDLGEQDENAVQVLLAHDRRGWIDKTAVQVIGEYE